MAKFVMVCARRGAAVPRERVTAACDLLGPGGVAAVPPRLSTRDGLVLAVVSATAVTRISGTSLCLGQMFSPADGWDVPGGPVSDGSFAVARADDDRVQLVTDVAASRNLFYAMTDGLFVASTSQRAIVAVLGSFEPNPVALSWMLSSGTLGPETWDRRITRVEPDSSVMLDRASWKLTPHHRPIVFRAETAGEPEHARRLQDAVLSACDALDLDGLEWRLPLSGGYDSRMLLLALSRRHRVSCITWGAPTALDEPGNDGRVARELARHLGVPHEFFPLEPSAEDAGVLLERFLANGDGCVDHLGGYADGFAIWRHLRELHVDCIVRADQGCGWEPVVLPVDVRRGLGAVMLEELWPPAQVEALGLAPQRWPAELERRDGESLAAWRDRLYLTWRVPAVLAALTELKAGYCEVLSPLLSRRVVEVVQALPDELRTGKRLFKEVVAAQSPPVPFATRNAIPELRLLVHGGPFLELARREVIAGRDDGTLPPRFAEHLIAMLPAAAAVTGAASAHPRDELSGLRERAAASLRRLLPRPVQSAIRAVRRHPPAPGTLAMRAAIASRMARSCARAAGGPAAAAAVTR